jgi:hypothetical protein
MISVIQSNILLLRVKCIGIVALGGCGVGEGLLEFVIRSSPVLELQQVDNTLLVLGSPQISQTGTETIVKSIVGFSTIEMAQLSDL